MNSHSCPRSEMNAADKLAFSDVEPSELEAIDGGAGAYFTQHAGETVLNLKIYTAQEINHFGPGN